MAPTSGKIKSLWFCDGYADSGLYVNQYGQKNAYTSGAAHGPDWWSGNTGTLQNVWHSDYQLNQLFGRVGKHLDTSSGWDIGGQAEIMYGTDAAFMQSAGLEASSDGVWADGDYYTAISQLYAEVGYRNFSVKVGKFYTVIGYETINSPDRFFYSLSHMFGLNPATHSGALATWETTKKLTLFGGWVNGQEKFFYTNKDNAFLGGGSYVFNERAYVRYAIMSGKNCALPTSRQYLVQSLVFGIRPTEKWEYTFEWLDRNIVPEIMHYIFTPRDIGGKYGINQELIYHASEKWSFGVRVEWVYGSLPPYPFPGSYIINKPPDNHYEITLGANWKPTKWLLVKPEIRYDKFEHSYAFNWEKGRPKKDQFSGGFSTVISF